MSGSKQCNRCGETKPFTDFSKGPPRSCEPLPTDPRYYRVICKPCHVIYMRDWYASKPEKRARQIERAREFRAENPAYGMWQRSRNSARKAGHEFTITPSDLLPLPSICPVLGIALDYFTAGKWNQNSASVDRWDNTEGYVPGNVRVISLRANQLKSDATGDELRAIADYCDGKERFPPASPLADSLHAMAVHLCA